MEVGKLEAPPIHPLLTAITLPDYGASHAQKMRELPYLHVLIALLQQSGTTLLQQRLRFHFHHFFLPYKASMPFLDGQDAAFFAK